MQCVTSPKIWGWMLWRSWQRSYPARKIIAEMSSSGPLSGRIKGLWVSGFQVWVGLFWGEVNPTHIYFNPTDTYLPLTTPPTHNTLVHANTQNTSYLSAPFVCDIWNKHPPPPPSFNQSPRVKLWTSPNASPPKICPVTQWQQCGIWLLAEHLSCITCNRNLNQVMFGNRSSPTTALSNHAFAQARPPPPPSN